MNVRFHLFQKLTDLFTVVIVLKQNKPQDLNMRNFPEMTEESLRDVMTEESLAEMTDTLEIEESLAEMTEENQVETNLEN